VTVLFSIQGPTIYGHGKVMAEIHIPLAPRVYRDSLHDVPIKNVIDELLTFFFLCQFCFPHAFLV
jgi:hypothetical protein